MIDKNLLDYIHSALAQGQTKAAIKNALVANGWQSDMVEEAFNLSRDTINSQPQEFAAAAKTLALHKRRIINSPLSVLLAIVLTVSLFILTNKIISDISDHFGINITASLIMNGLIILPFLLLAFGLHFTIGEKHEKYLILSRPYYIIAGWLVIRLLYEVSKYLLNQDTVYGVYVVLILVIAVLTSMVIFVQKYLKQ